MKEAFVVRVDDRLDQINCGMARESAQRRPDRRRAGKAPILLGNVAAGPVTAASRNDDSRDAAHLEVPSTFFLLI
jgi:hypothetical protein